MWNKLQKQIAVEKESLSRLIEAHRSLLSKCPDTPPEAIEISALASMLHSFYTGIENLFKRIAIVADGVCPRAEMWHTQLLNSMAKPTSKRPSVINKSLCVQLQAYLEFRHVFRHAYSFELRWSKMAPLVLACEDTLQLLYTELDRFLDKIQSEQKEDTGDK